MREQKQTKIVGWIMGIFLVGMLWSASGATITWTGNVSSNWENPFNWSPTNAAPGTNDTAYFNYTVSNSCVVPSNTTQTVGALDCYGFSGSGNDRKLIIQPGAALHNTTNTTRYALSYAGDHGIIEVQSNAVLTSSNCNFYIATFYQSQGTMNIIGGRVIMGGAFGFGLGNESATVSGYTGAVNVSAGGYLSCNNELRVAQGGWSAPEAGRGVLTIRDEGSLVQAVTFIIGEGSTGASIEGNARGSVIVYGGTLSAGTLYNARAAGGVGSTNTGSFTIRGGQLLVSGNMYNSSAETNMERGTITIASGATNLLVSGNYYQRTNGTLIVEITATNHPPLKANGTNYLAGTLRVASNSVEQLGQWDIIIGDADTNSASPGISGQFNTFDASAMPHPANWILSYTADKATVTYSPRGTLVRCH